MCRPHPRRPSCIVRLLGCLGLLLSSAIILAVFIDFLFLHVSPGALIASSFAATTPPALPTSTPWTTVHDFNGTGNEQTPTFSVPDNWRLIWTCDLAPFGGKQYSLIVNVSNADGSVLVPDAINKVCMPGHTTAITQEFPGGTVYLDITSEAAWTMEVQVPT